MHHQSLSSQPKKTSQEESTAKPFIALTSGLELNLIFLSIIFVSCIHSGKHFCLLCNFSCFHHVIRSILDFHGSLLYFNTCDISSKISFAVLSFCVFSVTKIGLEDFIIEVKAWKRWLRGKSKEEHFPPEVKRSKWWVRRQRMKERSYATLLQKHPSRRVIISHILHCTRHFCSPSGFFPTLFSHTFKHQERRFDVEERM